MHNRTIGKLLLRGVSEARPTEMATLNGDYGLSSRELIVVVDISTGDSRPVAQGRAAIWPDEHRLLVEV